MSRWTAKVVRYSYIDTDTNTPVPRMLPVTVTMVILSLLLSMTHGAHYDNHRLNSFEVKAAEVKTVEEPAKLEHLSPVVDSVIKISETLEEIEKIQHHMRVQEQSQRDSMIHTLSTCPSIITQLANISCIVCDI